MPAVNDTAFPEDFTLGMSKFVEPDITTDVVNCNTALYAQNDALAPGLLMVPTQEKPTVMASQLQQQMIEAEHEEWMQPDREKVLEDGNLPLFPTEEAGLMSRDVLHASKAEAAEELGGTFDILTSAGDDESSQTKEDEGESQPEEEAQATSWSEEEPAQGSQSEGAVSQEENDREPEREQESPEGPSPDSQAEDENDGTPGEEDEEQTSEYAKEHISRRAHGSEGGVVPVGDAGGESADVSEMGNVMLTVPMCVSLKQYFVLI